MDSESDSNDEQPTTVPLTMNEAKILEIRRERKAEQKRRRNQLKKLRKQLRIPGFSYHATPPSSSSNVTFTNIPGLSYSDSVNVINNLASPLNVAKNLDFFPNNLRFLFVTNILPPQIYLLRPSVESTFVFNLSYKVIQLISEDRSSKDGYNYGVLLRISQVFDELSNFFFDSVPTALNIVVNSEPVPFSDQYTRFFESPIDISELVKPLNEIKLKLQSFDDTNIVLGVYFVRMLTVEKAIHNFKLEYTKNWRSASKAKEVEAKMFSNRSGTIRLSLKCPISKKRLEVPCVGADCSHVQCFDLEPFVRNHHRNFQWRCPICKQLMRSVVRDKLFTKMIENVAPNCTDVGYFQSGSQVVELAHEKEPQPEIIEFPDCTKKDRFESSIIEEIYIERI